ncbi:MAG: hypothetical protein KDC35_18130 [Acidobacteria bacterium]|nr:hypothetical protein [Acidobacteriota bacterium]
MRAQSLIELLFALLLGTVIVGAIVSIGRSISAGYVALRQQVGVEGNVQMARDSVLDLMLELEPEFWEVFPRRHSAVCLSDEPIHPAIDVSMTCSLDEAKGACLTFWNLEATERDREVYRVADHEFPQSLTLVPLDDLSPPGLGPAWKPFSVVLLSDGIRHGPLLVDRVGHTQIFLREGELQPWSTELEFDWVNTHAIHLGQLKLIHLAVVEDPQRGGKLKTHTLERADGAYKIGRGITSYYNLEKLAVTEQPPSVELISHQEDVHAFVAW